MKPQQTHVATISASELLEIATRLQLQDRYLTITEVCKLTGYKRRSIFNAKDLPRYKAFGGHPRFRLSEVHRWMSKHAEQIKDVETHDPFVNKIKRAMRGNK